MSETATRIRRQFEELAPGWAADEPEWLTALRREAMERFSALGLPTRRDEEFKYTPVAKLFERELGLRAPAGLPGKEAKLPDLGTDVRIVFVNGRFAPSLSSLGNIGEGSAVVSLASALRNARNGVPSWLSECARFDGRGLAALNTACMSDGALITLPAGLASSAPVHVLHLTTQEASGTAVHSRNVIVAEPGSRIEVIEHHLGHPDVDVIHNVVTQVVAGEDAFVRVVKIQEEGLAASHLSSVDAIVRRGGRFEHRSVSAGASTARTETRVRLAGEAAHCDLAGLYLGRGKQLQDQLTLVDHEVPLCTSRQMYKGILDDSAQGVFNGLVIVRADAQKTLAEQSNRNLVLTETAVAHTRPQLDISADDVRCSHGATVGTLDEEAMFYLRSRGLGTAAARSLLIQAFALEILKDLPEGRVRDHAERIVSEWLD